MRDEIQQAMELGSLAQRHGVSANEAQTFALLAGDDRMRLEAALSARGRGLSYVAVSDALRQGRTAEQIGALRALEG